MCWARSGIRANTISSFLRLLGKQPKQNPCLGPPQCPRPTPGGTGAHIRVTGATSCARHTRARAGARGVVTQRARGARRRRGPASSLVVGSLSRGRPSHRRRPAVVVLASWSRATDLYFLIKFFLALQRLYRVRCESSGFSLSSQRHFRRLKTDWREIATDKYNNFTQCVMANATAHHLLGAGANQPSVTGTSVTTRMN